MEAFFMVLPNLNQGVTKSVTKMKKGDIYENFKF